MLINKVHFVTTLQQYPHQAEFTPDVLVKWIFENTHLVSVWVTPPGVKSLTLAPYVEEGSVLILFTPRNPLQDWNYNYNMVSASHSPGVGKLCSQRAEFGVAYVLLDWNLVSEMLLKYSLISENF
jgi:hypothetical protein